MMLERESSYVQGHINYQLLDRHINKYGKRIGKYKKDSELAKYEDEDQDQDEMDINYDRKKNQIRSEPKMKMDLIEYCRENEDESYD